MRKLQTITISCLLLLSVTASAANRSFVCFLTDQTNSKTGLKGVHVAMIKNATTSNLELPSAPLIPSDKGDFLLPALRAAKQLGLPLRPDDLLNLNTVCVSEDTNKIYIMGDITCRHLFLRYNESEDVPAPEYHFPVHCSLAIGQVRAGVEIEIVPLHLIHDFFSPRHYHYPKPLCADGAVIPLRCRQSFICYSILAEPMRLLSQAYHFKYPDISAEALLDGAVTSSIVTARKVRMAPFFNFPPEWGVKNPHDNLQSAAVASPVATNLTPRRETDGSERIQKTREGARQGHLSLDHTGFSLPELKNIVAEAKDISDKQRAVLMEIHDPSELSERYTKYHHIYFSCRYWARAYTIRITPGFEFELDDALDCPQQKACVQAAIQEKLERLAPLVEAGDLTNEQVAKIYDYVFNGFPLETIELLCEYLGYEWPRKMNLPLFKPSSFVR